MLEKDDFQAPSDPNHCMNFVVLRNCNICNYSSVLQFIMHGHNALNPQEIPSGINDMSFYRLTTSSSTLND